MANEEIIETPWEWRPKLGIYTRWVYRRTLDRAVCLGYEVKR